MTTKYKTESLLFSIPNDWMIAYQTQSSDSSVSVHVIPKTYIIQAYELASV